MRFQDTNGCKSGVHCHACRTSLAFRESIVRSKMAATVFFECRLGIPIAETPEEVYGLGSVIERLVKPVAVAINHPCLDSEKKLKVGSPCGKIRDGLNKVFPLAPTNQKGH